MDPPAPSARVEGVPPDLDALCRALLQRDPALRPSGAEILRRLRAGRDEVGETAPASATDRGASPLVGRRDEKLALRDAFEAARAGTSVTLHVRGRSGMGKSSLLQRFVDDLEGAGEAVVLRGRTYERESVPYKALDGCVDALSGHLLRLSDRGAQVALPGDIWALARLFPVLRRVPEIADVRGSDAGDPHRMRRRGFAALRELLASLASRQALVVHLDDVHWGDADSAALLLDLVRPPSAPPLLLVMTYREDGAETSPLLEEMRSQWPHGAEAREMAVGPLDAGDAAQLALALLGSSDDAARATAAAVARESHGSPFLIEELVRSHQARPRREAGEEADHARGVGRRARGAAARGRPAAPRDRRGRRPSAARARGLRGGWSGARRSRRALAPSQPTLRARRSARRSRRGGDDSRSDPRRRSSAASPPSGRATTTAASRPCSRRRRISIPRRSRSSSSAPARRRARQGTPSGPPSRRSPSSPSSAPSSSSGSRSRARPWRRPMPTASADGSPRRSRTPAGEPSRRACTSRRQRGNGESVASSSRGPRPSSSSRPAGSTRGVACFTASSPRSG